MSKQATLSIRDITCLNRNGEPMHTPIGNEAFIKLVSSIRKNGLLIPIYINKKKECLAGHFRFLAAEEANLLEVPIRIAEKAKDINYADD